MKLLSLLALLCAFAYFIPLRLVGALTERAISAPRAGGWNTTARDQTALSVAHGAALRQAQLFNAYPTAATLAIGTLRLVGVR